MADNNYHILILDSCGYVFTVVDACDIYSLHSSSHKGAEMKGYSGREVRKSGRVRVVKFGGVAHTSTKKPLPPSSTVRLPLEEPPVLLDVMHANINK